MMRNTLILSVALLLAAGPAWSVENAAQVTASLGTTASGGDALGMREGLADGADLETGDDGNCSLLVDGDALMEVCGNTSLKLERKEGQADGTRVVKLDKGEIRMVVEPRVGEERIEIHTPAAIATILGTVFFASVDALGVTTITTVSNQVMVTSNDPNVPGATTINGGEQIVIRPGEAPPPEATQVSKQTIGGLGGCLIDFHAVSLAADRGSQETDKVAEVVAADVVDVLPGVGSGPPIPQIPSGGVPDPTEQNPLTPVDTARASGVTPDDTIVDPVAGFPGNDPGAGLPCRSCPPVIP